ncbi:MAG: helix-turn-helix domain-containing protein [Actinomycetales bacterium]|nr:helix-turn-helix domain-containing protein [Actinomycetales bacterium]
MSTTLLEQARREAGLTQAQLADLAGTSHPTVSAYERGRKIPRLDTVERLLAKTGHELAIVPARAYTWHKVGRGRPFAVPSALPRLPIDRAFATVTLPLSVDWSEPRRAYNLRDRQDRIRVYQLVLREGGPVDIDAAVDGALLIDVWDDVMLPKEIRVAWSELIERALNPAGMRWHRSPEVHRERQHGR